MFSKTIRSSQGLTPKHFNKEKSNQVSSAHSSKGYSAQKSNSGTGLRQSSNNPTNKHTNEINFYSQQDETYNRLKQNVKQKKLDTSRSSESSTSSDGEGNSSTLGNQVSSLITQVKKQDCQSTNKSQGSPSKQEAQNEPVIYQSRFQPSTEFAKQQMNQHKPPVTHNPQHLLQPQADRDRGKKTLVLDLDETLVHSSFKPIDNADIIQPVEIDGKIQYVYVLVRPFCEEFISRMSEHFEIVMFTASLQKYAEPLYSKLDTKRVTSTNLYREHCTFYNGLFVKDMARLGRNLEDVIIIDNSPNSFLFQPENALPSINWYDDKGCRELMDFVPLLERLARVPDVRAYLTQFVIENKVNYIIANDMLNIKKYAYLEDHLVMTPPKSSRQEESSSNNRFHSAKNSHQQPALTNSHSTKTITLQSSSLKTTTPQHNAKTPKATQNDLTKDSYANRSIQSSIEQMKKQQQVQEKQQAQIDNMKNKILQNTWTSTPTKETAASTQSFKKDNKLSADNSSITNTSQFDSRQNKTSDSLTKLQANIRNSESKQNSVSNSLSDQKYQEYLSSLTKHSKRTGSAPQSDKQKKSATIEQGLHTQRSQNSSVGASTINANKNGKRPSSAYTRGVSQSTSASTTQAAKSLRQTSASKSTQGSLQTRVGTETYSAKNQKSNSINPSTHVFNFSSTPDRSNKTSKVHGSVNNTPKTQGNSLTNLHSSNTKNSLSNSQSKRESSFSTLQQKNNQLRKNFANFIKNIESSNPIVGSQTTQAAKTNSFKLKDNLVTKPSPMNKFITRFESGSNHLSTTQTPQHSEKLSSKSQKSLTLAAQNTEKQANKNHLQYSTIYSKLTQANQNFSMNPSGFSNLSQQNNNAPVKAGPHHGHSQRGSSNSSAQNSLNKTPVNMIALQMLKSASSPNQRH